MEQEEGEEDLRRRSHAATQALTSRKAAVREGMEAIFATAGPRADGHLVAGDIDAAVLSVRGTVGRGLSALRHHVHRVQAAHHCTVVGSR